MSINVTGRTFSNTDAAISVASLGFSGITASIEASSFASTGVIATAAVLALTPVDSSVNNELRVATSTPSLAISPLDPAVAGTPVGIDTNITASTAVLSLTANNSSASTSAPLPFPHLAEYLIASREYMDRTTEGDGLRNAMSYLDTIVLGLFEGGDWDANGGAGTASVFGRAEIIDWLHANKKGPQMRLFDYFDVMETTRTGSSSDKYYDEGGPTLGSGGGTGGNALANWVTFPGEATPPSAGTAVSDWFARQGTGEQRSTFGSGEIVNTNITDYVAVDSQGRRVSEYYADIKLAAHFDSIPTVIKGPAGIGGYMDVMDIRPKSSTIDFNGDGSNDSARSNWNTPGTQGMTSAVKWREGQVRCVDRFNNSYPAMEWMANGATYNAGEYSGTDMSLIPAFQVEYQDLLVGVVVEGQSLNVGQFPFSGIYSDGTDRYSDGDAGTNFGSSQLAINNYVCGMNGCIGDKLVYNDFHVEMDLVDHINPTNFPTHLVRYALTMTLMDDGFCAITRRNDRGTVPLFDEYGVTPATLFSLGKGWLGAAIDPPQHAPRYGTIWIREFENGVAIWNGDSDGDNADTTIDVTGPSGLGADVYERILGTQDPVVNDGSVVSSNFSLPTKDGLVLKRRNLVSQSWVGIPDPAGVMGYDPINIVEPVDPPEWPGAESVGNYYVDPSHPSSTDSSNTYGYPNRPRNTPTSTTIAGGNKYVIVGDGNSYSGSQISFSGTSASASDPYWVVGRSATDITNPANRPIFSGREVRLTSSYGILSNFKVEHQVGGSVLVPVSNFCTLRNFELEGTGVVVGSGGACIALPSNSCAYNGTIHDMGEWQTNNNADLHGCKSSGTVSNVFYLNIDGYRIQGDTIQIGDAGGNALTVTNIYLGGISGHDNKENCIDLKDCTDVIISGGEDYGMSTTWGDDAGAGVVIHDDANYAWVIGRKCRDSARGIIFSGSTLNNYVINCEFKDFTTTGTSGGPFFDPGVAISFQNGVGTAINNTFHNCRKGIEFTVGSTPLEVKNNLFKDRNTTDPDNWDIMYENSSDLASSDQDYNMFDGSFRCRGGSTNYTSLSSWRSATPHDDNSIEELPYFIDEANDDFRLTSSSPAAKSGIPTKATAFATFESRYGFSIEEDLLGNPRPASGTDWSIGAYERQVLTGITSIQSFGDSWASVTNPAGTYTTYSATLAASLGISEQNRAVSGAPTGSIHTNQILPEISAGVDTTGLYIYSILPNDLNPIVDLASYNALFAGILAQIETNMTASFNALQAAGVENFAVLMPPAGELIPLFALGAPAFGVDPNDFIDDVNGAMIAACFNAGIEDSIHYHSPLFYELDGLGTLNWDADNKHYEQNVHTAIGVRLESDLF